MIFRNLIITMPRKPVKKIIFRVLNFFFASGLDGVKIMVNTRKLMILIIRYILRSSCSKKAKEVFTMHETSTRKNTYRLYNFKTTPRE
jgi:hypothetical protein